MNIMDKKKISKTKKKSTIKNKSTIKKITNNFCETHHKLFKKMYLFINNPNNLKMTMDILIMLHHPKMHQVILEKLKENKEEIKSIFDNFNIIMNYYKVNHELLKTELGHFILYYDNELKKIKLRNDRKYLEFFYKIMGYPKLFSLMKELLYILSDYRSCIYFMTPSIQFQNTDIKTIDSIISKFHTNQKILFSMISKSYPQDNCPWGSPIYTGAYACFLSLMILNKYYRDPIKKLKIIFQYKKQYSKTQILKKIEHIYKVKLNQTKKIINVTQFIILLKKMGYDLYSVIDLVFELIFEKPIFKNIQECYIINGKKIYHQKKNYEFGIKIYILVSKGFITNTNCFEHFNV